MRITPLIVEEIKRTIPDAIALDPLINITRMQRHLEEQFNRSFSFYYTRTLMHKVAMPRGFTEVRRELDRVVTTDLLPVVRFNSKKRRRPQLPRRAPISEFKRER